MLESNSEFIDFQDISSGEHMPLPKGLIAIDQSHIFEEDDDHQYSNLHNPINVNNFIDDGYLNRKKGPSTDFRKAQINAQENSPN